MVKTRLEGQLVKAVRSVTWVITFHRGALFIISVTRLSSLQYGEGTGVSK